MFALFNRDKTVKSIHSSRMRAKKEGAKGLLVKVDEDMCEAQLTKVYNYMLDANVTRIRNKEKILRTVRAKFREQRANSTILVTTSNRKAERKARAIHEAKPTNRQPSVKARVRTLLENDCQKRKRTGEAGGYTMSQLCELTDSIKSTVSTGLSDLRSHTYAGAGGALIIHKNDESKYYI